MSQQGRVTTVQKKTVAVLDYGSGNIHSAVHALRRLGAKVEVTADAEQVLNADGLVVPGVGSFDAVANGLRAIEAMRWIGRRIAGGRAVLGICVGHQILFETGVEHGITTEGMGEWPGTVEKLPAEVLPHMGWSEIRAPENSVLFAGLHRERFYFVHSYAVRRWEFDQNSQHMRPPQVTWAHHGSDFIAAIENGPLSGTQFHPEKSGDAGMQLLNNWIGTL
ncbi:imidazole glycerol phosphate synthase subunit HisH [Auritidibacter ignavus]|uniref:imidazole glycerol phosphate synthase subunit HisH n=1 Tax=Auritidibacter ignavus TaxID=678932 RepID=UPI002447DB68|nr:imidazole glycerol phosphate synthase subunit HisH [Auritidibacter ignavus]WGH84688.1 imidazole glycerol phosphate synthase subunit HisH [Auritidibacter ignavus]